MWDFEYVPRVSPLCLGFLSHLLSQLVDLEGLWVPSGPTNLRTVSYLKALGQVGLWHSGLFLI